MIKDFKETVEKWDGNGFPKLPGKWFKDVRRPMKEDGVRLHMKEKPVVP